MAYMALYRKWRPMTFEDVVEQGAVVNILKNAVMTGRIAHAYLFCGTRGTGKTTLAKIFARAVNCEQPKDGNPCNECAVCRGIINQQILDVSEIDAASNNGVDNIRAIIDETAYASSVARYRVYIIDEVHMLSAGAFNALLKTLEEPPADVIFILATTEPHKLPVTILSRCQRYDFKRISQQGIIGRLEEICRSSDIQYAPEALAFLAQKADGAMRDAISLLDQTIASCGSEITLAGARSATGSLDKEVLEHFTEALLASNGQEILKMTHRLFTDGRDPSNFIGELMQVFRNMLIVLTVNNPSAFLYEDEAGLARLKALCGMTTTGEISLFIQALSRLDNALKWAVQRKIVFEAGMLSLCDRKWSTEDGELLARMTALEERVSDLVAKGIRVGARTEVPTQSQPATTAPIPAAPVTQAPAAVPKVEAPAAETPIVAAPKAEAHKAETPQPPVSPAKHVVAGGRDVDPTDWKDFVSNISGRGKPSLASLFNTSSKGVLVSGNTLAAVFHSKMMRDMVSKQDCGELINRCASDALGYGVQVILTTKDELPDVLEEYGRNQGTDAVAPTPVAAPVNTASADDFEASFQKLQALSEMQGFEITEV